MKTDQALLDAAKHYRSADKELMRCLRRAMRPRRRVHWQHGNHRRIGTVISLLGFSSDSARVRVEGIPSGKVYDVPAATIVASIGGAA